MRCLLCQEVPSVGPCAICGHQLNLDQGRQGIDWIARVPAGEWQEHMERLRSSGPHNPEDES